MVCMATPAWGAELGQGLGSGGALLGFGAWSTECWEGVSEGRHWVYVLPCKVLAVY